MASAAKFDRRLMKANLFSLSERNDNMASHVVVAQQSANAESYALCARETATGFGLTQGMKLKPIFLSGMLLVFLALAISSCADQEGTEGSGLDGPPDSSPSRSSLGPGGSSIYKSW
jgi:hypothetical protein